MLSSLLRILALIRKEFLAVLKDPRSRFIIFLPPMLQCLIFGYAASFDLNSVAYAVYDQDHSAASMALLSRLDGSGVFERQADLGRAKDIGTWIDSGRALLVIQIDQNFERNLLAGSPAPLEVIADGRNSNTAGTALGYLNSVVERFNGDWRSSHGQQGASIQIVTRSWYNPNLDSRWTMIPSLIGTLTMMGTMMLTALSVAREREQGTFDQLLVTPFRPFEIMVGKAVPNMVIGLGQSTTVLLIAQFWFRIPFAGSFVVLYAGLTLLQIGNHGGESRAQHGHRLGPIDHRIADRAILVSHPVRRILCRSLCGAHLVPDGCGRPRPVCLPDRQDHAAGHALRIHTGDAVRAALWIDDTIQQHAQYSSNHHDHQSAALRARSDQTGIFGGCRVREFVCRFSAAVDHRIGYALGRGLAVQATAELMKKQSAAAGI